MTDRIEVLTHSAIRIQSSLGTIYIDPFQVKEEYHDAAFILITHDHYDHFSPEDIAKVNTDATIMIVPENMEKKARKVAGLVSELVTVQPNTSAKVNDLELEMIPAYNTVKPFHPKSAGWVGYILTVDGERIYVAGDTGLTPESKEVKCDIALVPIGGTYTMSFRRASNLINIIRPRVAIPTHYGNTIGKPEDADNFECLVDPEIAVEKKIKF